MRLILRKSDIILRVSLILRKSDIILRMSLILRVSLILPRISLILRPDDFASCLFAGLILEYVYTGKSFTVRYGSTKGALNDFAS